jgi:hypothetical protein
MPEKKQRGSEKKLIARLMVLFASYSRASGTHGVPERDPNGLKWSIKKTAKTMNLTVTEELWSQHIGGKRPLGLVSILDDSTCSWGCIDIDKYNVDHLEVIARIESMKLPLVPCRSKSNGLHLFMFMKEPVQAAIVQLALRNIAAMIGFADSEIFPKQTQIQSHEGDSGSWMVMPYFGGTFGGKLQLQHGLKKTGAEMTLEEFVSYSEKRLVTEEQIVEIRQRSIQGGASEPKKMNGKKSHAPFSDGPPCLQFMCESGFPDGGRNNALMHIGVYLKKAQPAKWKEMLEQDNQKYMKPPLPSDEVMTVIASLEKKDYEYFCKNQPMSSHCDSVTCRTRKYGVGNDMYPEILAIRKLMTEPAVWFLDVMGLEGAVTLKLSTDQMQIYQRFQNACLEHATTMHKALNQNAWASILIDAMPRVEFIDAPPDVGIGGRFAELLETFLTNRTKGAKREDILRGAPWEDEEEARHYFRLSDLQKFMERENVKMSRTDIIARVKELHGVKDPSFYPHRFLKIKDKGVNVWWIPSAAIEEIPEIAPPEMPREQI